MIDVERLARLETVVERIDTNVKQLSQKLSNGISSNVAILMEDRKTNKWILRALIGAVLTITVTIILRI